MNKIRDFKCQYDNASVINSEISKELDLVFPDLHLEWEPMARLAKYVKNQEKSAFCELPFCHTVEADAMGGRVNYGNEKIGPRAAEYICDTVEDFLELEEIDYSKGRIREVLKACDYLNKEGELVCLSISGPFTLLNVLIDPRHIFKVMKKNPEQMREVYQKIEKELLTFIEEAMDNGVKIISYADSAGGVNILGPKLAIGFVEDFTYPFLKKVEKLLEGKETIVHLCPKTTLSLLDTDKASYQEIKLHSENNYRDGFVEVIGKASFVGQMCIANTELQLKSGIINAVQLI